METAPTHVTEAGAMVVEPPSLVPFDVEVYVELADGAVKAYPAFGRRGSTVGFRVPLGARSYGYQLGDGFSATLACSSARTVDFGAVVAGRADRAEAMRVTPVVLGFDGLSPWTTSDDLWVFSAGAGLHLPLICPLLVEA